MGRRKREIHEQDNCDIAHQGPDFEVINMSRFERAGSNRPLRHIGPITPRRGYGVDLRRPTVQRHTYRYETYVIHTAGLSHDKYFPFDNQNSFRT